MQGSWVTNQTLTIASRCRHHASQVKVFKVVSRGCRHHASHNQILIIVSRGCRHHALHNKILTIVSRGCRHHGSATGTRWKRPALTSEPLWAVSADVSAGTAARGTCANRQRGQPRTQGGQPRGAGPAGFGPASLLVGPVSRPAVARAVGCLIYAM